MGLPTDKRSKTISLIEKSSFSWAMNWMILTNMFSGVSLGTTAFDPFGNRELTMLWSLRVKKNGLHLIKWLHDVWFHFEPTAKIHEIVNLKQSSYNNFKKVCISSKQ